MDFEWDPAKALHNKQKHRIAFDEAATVFADPMMLTFSDPDHSFEEQRYVSFGVSQKNRHLVVSHTERNERIRIINARLMTRRERRIYEED